MRMCKLFTMEINTKPLPLEEGLGAIVGILGTIHREHVTLNREIVTPSLRIDTLKRAVQK